MRLGTLLLTCLASATLCLAAGAQPGDAARANAPTLSVCLAVPDVGYDGEPIYLNDKSFHFHVVIQNVSDMPQKIWSDSCSWGYGTTVLELTAIDGKPLPKPLYVSQGGRAWSANFPMPLTLQPGEMLVRDVHLNVPRPDPKAKPGTPFAVFPWGPDYFGFPLPEHGDTETVSIRAVFVIQDGLDARKKGVWTGRIASSVHPVTVIYRPSEPMF